MNDFDIKEYCGHCSDPSIKTLDEYIETCHKEYSSIHPTRNPTFKIIAKEKWRFPPVWRTKATADTFDEIAAKFKKIIAILNPGDNETWGDYKIQCNYVSTAQEQQMTGENKQLNEGEVLGNSILGNTGRS